MIVAEIEWREPLAAFGPLAGQPFAHLLHAGERIGAPGWSIIVTKPVQHLEAKGAEVFLNGRLVDQSPFEALARLHGNRCTDPVGPGVFRTGLVGFCGYELAGAIEPEMRGPASPFSFPDMAFGAYDASLIFDRSTRRAFICAAGEAAKERLEAALMAPPQAVCEYREFSDAGSNLTPDEYRNGVNGIIARILEGEFYQVNLTQQLTAKTGDEIRGLDIFERIISGSDAAFGALLQFGEGEIVSNSPERFFSMACTDTEKCAFRILAEPIKGTRPRSEDPEQDKLFEKALLADPKDRAENIMIADLMRNDLSRICADGSIREEAICELMSLQAVHHLVSRISGELRADLTAVDVIEALFPCGSITGAPKIQAMKAIAELEGRGRGPYCGCIGYIDDGGAADFSVAIRTLLLERDANGTKAVFPVGGGVTLRSDPDAEYQESLVKAQNFRRALGLEGSASA